MNVIVQVHAAATTNTEKKKTNQKETRQEQLAHIQVNNMERRCRVAQGVSRLWIDYSINQ